MSLSIKVLGKPGKDNAMFAAVDSGTNMTKMLFDCGENIFKALKQREVKSIKHLFFSHFHFDHAAGFDYFFRRNYQREEPVNVWGTTGTSKFIFNKLNSYTWNLVEDLKGRWNIYEFDDNIMKHSHIFAADGFAKLHNDCKFKKENVLYENDDITIISALLDHRIPSAAYRITEKQKFNIDKEKLVRLEFTTGAWLEKVRNNFSEGEVIIDGKPFSITALRRELLIPKRVESIAYLTDFIYNEENIEKCLELISGCDVVVCESQYLEKDADLAKRNFHLTAKQAAAIGRDAGCKKLVLFHISDRYNNSEKKQILSEAREVFDKTYFPEEWITE